MTYSELIEHLTKGKRLLWPCTSYEHAKYAMWDVAETLDRNGIELTFRRGRIQIRHASGGFIDFIPNTRDAEQKLYGREWDMLASAMYATPMMESRIRPVATNGSPEDHPEDRPNAGEQNG